MVYLNYTTDANGNITDSDNLYGAKTFDIGRENNGRIRFTNTQMRFFQNDLRVYNLSGGTTNPIPFLRVFGRIRSNFALIISDDRYKHNEVDISNALMTIRKLNPKTYDKTQIELSANFTGSLDGIENYKESGLIAQELIKIEELKHCVYSPTEEEEPYSVNYNDIFIFALSAIKELDAKVLRLEALLEKNNIV